MVYYSPHGQEIIPFAISVNLTNEDYICTIYRGVHDMLAKGVPVRSCGQNLAAASRVPARAKAARCMSRIPKAG